MDFNVWLLSRLNLTGFGSRHENRLMIYSGLTEWIQSINSDSKDKQLKQLTNTIDIVEWKKMRHQGLDLKGGCIMVFESMNLIYCHKSSSCLKFHWEGSSGPSMDSLQLAWAKSIVCIGMGALARKEKNTLTLGFTRDSEPGSITTANFCDESLTSDPTG